MTIALLGLLADHIKTLKMDQILRFLHTELERVPPPRTTQSQSMLNVRVCASDAFFFSRACAHAVLSLFVGSTAGRGEADEAIREDKHTSQVQGAPLFQAASRSPGATPTPNPPIHQPPPRLSNHRSLCPTGARRSRVSVGEQGTAGTRVVYHPPYMIAPSAIDNS